MVFENFKQTTIKWFGGFDYYRINYMIYVMGGVWMLKKKYVQHSKKKIKMYNFFRGLVVFMNVVVFIDMVSDGYLVRNDLEKLTYSLSTSVFFMGSIFHLIALILKKDDFEHCLDLLNNNFYLRTVGRSLEDVEILNKGEQQLKNISKLFYVLLGVGLVTRTICHLAPEKKMMMLPFPNSDDLQSPFFEILFFLQISGMIHFITVLIASDMVMLGFIIRILKHFEILNKNIIKMKSVHVREDLEKSYGSFRSGVIISKNNPAAVVRWNLGESDENSEILKWRMKKICVLMKEAIAHHQQIKSVTTKMSDVLQTSLFLQIFGGGLLLGILFVDVVWKTQQLSMKIIAQAIYAGAFLLNTTILCYFGSEIQAKSQRAAKSLYATDWLQMDVNNRKTIGLFLKGLWAHPVLKAGGIMPVNLNTYVQFVNLIYNSMAFMQNAMKRSS